MTDTEKAMQQIIFLRILISNYGDEGVKRLPKAKLLETPWPKYLKSGNKTIEFDETLAGFLAARNPKPDAVLDAIKWFFEEWHHWPLMHQSARSIVESVKREMNLIK